jgi:hypothetical protein
VISLLLWARFLLLAAMGAVVAGYVWAALKPRK